MTNSYKPEGMIYATPENREYISSLMGLQRAMDDGKILESTVLLCDSRMRLHVDLYGIEGIIEREEAVLCRPGEKAKDIAVITRVGKPVCFKVLSITVRDGKPVAILSRRAAQLECMHNYLSGLICGDIIPARVTHLENFGAFVDIGCGISSLLSVDCISVSRISHPSDRLKVGDSIYTVIKAIDRENERIFVSMRELLGTWLENAAMFEAGQTVAGIVRSVEDYGVFVELAPNLAGLAEIRDGTNDRSVAVVGQYAAVYIKSIIPDRMKIKLVLIDSYKGEKPYTGIKYFVDVEHLSHMNSWLYSPENSRKIIETVFDEVRTD
ncbi:MAG: S1 RNA-binding domain-containing protein [Eubacteriales bacterium]